MKWVKDTHTYPKRPQGFIPDGLQEGAGRPRRFVGFMCFSSQISSTRIGAPGRVGSVLSKNPTDVLERPSLLMK